MIQTQVTIINKLGLHARAAAKLVACTSSFSSRIEMRKDNETADGKSIMAVMMLAAGKGTVLDLEIEGEDEADAHTALVALIENRFEEDE